MNQEPRLPQIDSITFAALNTIDGLLARAPLTRAEHAEANKSLQHLVQALESLQAAVRQMNSGEPPASRGLPVGEVSGHAKPSFELPGGANGAGTGPGNGGGGRVAAEIAEEIFRGAK